MTSQHIYNDCGHQLAAMGAALNYLFSVTINAEKESMNIENISLIVSILFILW